LRQVEAMTEQKRGSKVERKPIPRWVWAVVVVGDVLVLLFLIFFFRYEYYLKRFFQNNLFILLIAFAVFMVSIIFVNLWFSFKRKKRILSQLGLMQDSRGTIFAPSGQQGRSIPVKLEIRDTQHSGFKERREISVRYCFPQNLSAGLYFSNDPEKPGALYLGGILKQSVRPKWESITLPLSDRDYSSFYFNKDCEDLPLFISNKEVWEAVIRLAEGLIPFEGCLTIDDTGIVITMPLEAQLEPEITQLAAAVYCLFTERTWQKKTLPLFSVYNILIVCLILVSIVLFLWVIAVKK